MRTDRLSILFDRVINAKSEIFSDLAYLADLDPATDFCGVDLSGVDFLESDLRDFRFDNSILDNCDFRKCVLSERTISYAASMAGARLPPIHRYIGDRFTSISGKLSAEDRRRAEMEFGSMRGAISSALYAIREPADKKDLALLVGIMQSGATYRDLESKISHVTLPLYEAAQIRDIRDTARISAVDVVRCLLLIANAAANPVAYRGILDIEKHSIQGLVKRLPRSTPDPRQGTLF